MTGIGLGLVLAFGALGALFIVFPPVLAFGRYIVGCARRWFETP